MYRIYRKTPDPFQGDFEFGLKNRYISEEFRSILWSISWSLPDDEGGITCMHFILALLCNGTNCQHLYIINCTVTAETVEGFKGFLTVPVLIPILD